MEVVLLVADDRSLGEAVRAALGDFVLTVCESTVDSALRRLISLQVDVVIFDDAPGLGISAVRRVHELYPQLPILVLLNRGDNDTIASLVTSGASGYLVKPFSCEYLRRLIREVAPPRNLSQVTGASEYLQKEIPRSALSRYQTALRWLSRISSYLADSRRISDALIDATVDIFDVVRCAVALGEEQDNGFRLVAYRGIAVDVADSLRFSYERGVMRRFQRNACILSHADGTDTDAVKELAVVGARYAVPLFRGNKVCGALLVGEKACGTDYSPEEIELLTMLARGASIALDNAYRYEQLAKEQRQLQFIFSNISSGVVVVDANKTVTMVNGSAERILGIPASDVIGQSVQKLGSAFADVVLRALADGKPRIRQAIRNPVTQHQLGLTVTPLGEQGVVVIFSELPQERTSSEEIAYSPFWEYLASRVAQEIKNPMVAINTFAQLLPRKYDSPDFREAFAEIVQREVNRINNVVETLFDFARHPQLILQRVDVNETVQNVLRSFEEELEQRRIRLETDFDPAKPQATMDVAYVSQALQNVVQNSIEAMPEGGIIRVTTRKAADTCEILIADSGPGVSEQDASHIFDPFFSTKERGMGLGLTIAQRIARQHQGDLKLMPSKEGEGSVFQFRFPIIDKPLREQSHPVHED